MADHISMLDDCNGISIVRISEFMLTQQFFHILNAVVNLIATLYIHSNFSQELMTQQTLPLFLLRDLPGTYVSSTP